jgi:hypothetical protein
MAVGTLWSGVLESKSAGGNFVRARVWHRAHGKDDSQTKGPLERVAIRVS